MVSLGRMGRWTYLHKVRYYRKLILVFPTLSYALSLECCSCFRICFLWCKGRYYLYPCQKDASNWMNCGTATRGQFKSKHIFLYSFGPSIASIECLKARMPSTHFTRSAGVAYTQLQDATPNWSRDEQRLLRGYMEKLTGLKFTQAEAVRIANQLNKDRTAPRKASADSTSDLKRKLHELDSSSSLSPASQIASPANATGIAATEARSARVSPALSNSSIDEHQPPPAASMPQYPTFGPDPSTFDDPTVYHIREVTEDMADDQKKEIYGVSSFPKSDLSTLVAGKLPDKDFSNAKPTNQVNANTFAAYIEPYVRPLTEEDMAWLKERVSTDLLALLTWLYTNQVLGRPCRTISHPTPRQAVLQRHLGRRRRSDLRRWSSADGAPASKSGPR
jgi:hypothetical protein